MKCMKCGSPMDEKAAVCPNCGAPNPAQDTEEKQFSEKGRKKTVFLTVAVAAAILIAAISCAAFLIPVLSRKKEMEAHNGNVTEATAETHETFLPEEQKTGSSTGENAVKAPVKNDMMELETLFSDNAENPTESMNREGDNSKSEDWDYSSLKNTERAELHYSLEMQREPKQAFSEMIPESLYDAEFVPASSQESPAAGLSNVEQTELYYFSEEEKELLEKNGFIVWDTSLDEYYEVYEINRYDQRANLVTVDSLMHTYHLYFQYLLKSIEKEYLADKIEDMTRCMLRESMKQYSALNSDDEWAEAAFRNVAFFSVASRILSEKSAIPAEVEDLVDAELELISAASQETDSPVMGCKEDYTQYKPRGYYAGNEILERYFKAMMWYGRMNFRQKYEREDQSGQLILSDQLNRSALLMTLAMNEEECYENWEAVYSITSFFSGESDDLTYYDYIPAIKEAYGDEIKDGKITGDEKCLELFCELISGLGSPEINSLPLEIVGPGTVPDENLDNTKGFRFIGQRFTIDEAIFQQLVFDQIKRNAAYEKRSLPDALDIPAVLGSDEALEILKENGIEKFPDYVPRAEELRLRYSGDNTELWQTSLYSQWLYALKPLLEEKKTGYPWFMTGKEWKKKNLETFLGSYTELKHDTVLYSKQMYAMAEGDGEWTDEEEIDDRGYVEPEYKVYACISALVQNTKAGLEKYGFLNEDDAENLDDLGILSDALLRISEKELKNETLSEDEYELIRYYGTYLEHFWNYTRYNDPTRGENVWYLEESAAVIADIATDSEREIYLEVATGAPSRIYAVAPVDGKLKIVCGSVFSFYEFTSSERLTDSEWRQRMGLEMNEEHNYDKSKKTEHMLWTNGYR